MKLFHVTSVLCRSNCRPSGWRYSIQEVNEHIKAWLEKEIIVNHGWWNFLINVSKKRPGDYINFKSKRQQSPSGSTRGTALIPLIGLGWGPDKGILKLTAASPDADVAKLGHSIYDTNDFMLLIREAFKNAVTVIVYIINNGDKATKTTGGMTVTAAYGGIRGNDIAVACRGRNFYFHPVRGISWRRQGGGVHKGYHTAGG